MGFTVRLMLGAVLVLLCSSFFEAIELKRPTRQISNNGEVTPTDKLQKIENETTTQKSVVANLSEKITKPKTDVSTEEDKNLDKHSLVGKLQKPETYKKATNQQESKNTREEIGRSIDIDKYVSKEFHSKNNVYTLPISPDTERYINHDYDYHSTPHHHDHTKEFQFDSELTTPKSMLFDHKYKEAVESVEQKLEHIDDSHELSLESESKENLNLEKLYEETKNNETKADLDYVSYKNIIKNDTADKNALHKDLVVEAGTNLNFNSSYNKTTIIDENDGDNNTIVKEDTEISTKPNTGPVKGDLDKAESSTIKNILLTTRKSIILTKPPSTRNSSHISILSNNIETETVKAIPIQSTQQSKGEKEIVLEAITSRTPIDITKRGSIKFADYARPTEPTAIDANTINKEQLFQENQLVPVHVEAPKIEKTSNQTISETATTETTPVTEVETTESVTTETAFTTETVTTTEAALTTEAITTEITSTNTAESTESSTESVSVNTEPTTIEVITAEPTTLKSTTEDIATTTELEETTVMTTEIYEIGSSTTESVATTESVQRSSKGLVFNDEVTTMQPTTEIPVSTTTITTTTTTTPEVSTTEMPSTETAGRTSLRSIATTETTTAEAITVYETTETTRDDKQETTTSTISVTLVIENRTSLVPELKKNKEPTVEEFTPDLNTESTTIADLETTTETITVTDSFEHNPSGDNSGTIAAIVISSVAAVCLVLLAGLLVIIKKRQKRFNYGQRCTPVSLDDYSMDNVSVYNSVRRKGMLRSSKRSYGNPAFEDPASVSHPLNFPALGKFAVNHEDIKAEFEEIPQITARTNELPEGCDTKNRYANVIPLPETRVFLSPIDGYPNSDYINANYVTGPKNIKGYYIACQAPLQNTVDDFWRMIWEQQCKVILMLTHLFENGVEKCVDYLPPSEVLDCHRLFGDFQVTLKKREVKDKYIISILQLKNMVSNSWREVTHFWYLGWPEKGVPHEANSLIAFLIEARSYMKSSSIDRKDANNINLTNGTTKNELNPVVVHCSPGTGRTGVVIACDIAIREFEQTRLVDVPRIVYKIRRDRASSVQTKEQYAFIYNVISLYATKLTGGVLDSL